MKNRVKRWIWLGAMIAAASGCATKPKDGAIISENYLAGEVLLKSAETPRGVHMGLERHHPLLVASFVNVDNVQASSTFGRMLGEQIGSYFTQQGFDVVELRLRNDVLIKEETGELLLSREIKDISQKHDAQAVVVGTYAIGADEVYVTTKIIRAVDGIVIGSYDYKLPIGPNTKALLKNDRASGRR